MGNGALAIGPKLPRPSSTLPQETFRHELGNIRWYPDMCPRRLEKRVASCAAPYPWPSTLEWKARSPNWLPAELIA